MPNRKALALLTFCLVLSGCATKRVVTALEPPAERLQCQAAGQRPNIPPEYKIVWERVLSVPQAKAEHVKYVAALRAREGVIAAYLVSIEGKLFVCANNAEWLRAWYKGTNR